MDWKKLLAYISGSVDEELLLRNEYLATENRVLRAQIRGRLKLTDGERRTLAEIGRRLGRKALEEGARGSGEHREARYNLGVASETRSEEV